MANPQKENGFVSIATELVEAFARSELTQNESKILWVIIRKTYGWNKKFDTISLSFFENAACLPHWSVERALKGLLKKRLIIKNKINSRTVEYGIQKDYGQWIRHEIDTHEIVPNKGTKPCPKSGTPHAEHVGTNPCHTTDNKDKNRHYISRTRGEGVDWMVEKELVEAAKSEIPDLKKLGWDDLKIKDHLIQARGFSEKQADEVMGKEF